MANIFLIGLAVLVGEGQVCGYSAHRSTPHTVYRYPVGVIPRVLGMSWQQRHDRQRNIRNLPRANMPVKSNQRCVLLEWATMSNSPVMAGMCWQSVSPINTQCV